MMSEQEISMEMASRMLSLLGTAATLTFPLAQ